MSEAGTDDVSTAIPPPRKSTLELAPEQFEPKAAPAPVPAEKPTSFWGVLKQSLEPPPSTTLEARGTAPIPPPAPQAAVPPPRPLADVAPPIQQPVAPPPTERAREPEAVPISQPAPAAPIPEPKAAPSPDPVSLSKPSDTTSVVGVRDAAPELKTTSSFWDKLKGLIPDLTGGPETGGLKVTPETAPVFPKIGEAVAAPAKALASSLEETGKGYGEAIAEWSRPEIVAQRGGRDIPSGPAEPEGMLPKPAPGSREWIKQKQAETEERGGVLETPVGTMLGIGPGTIGRGPGTPPPIRQRTTPLAPGQQPGMADLARGVSHAIESVVSPTTMDTTAEMAEASINKAIGQARRETEVANAQLTNDMRRLTAPQIPEFQQYVKDIQAHIAAGTPIPPHTKPGLLRFLDYVEGRSAGAKLDQDIAHLQPLADTMRQIVQDRERAIAADPLTDVTSFIEDYYSHQWAEKARVPTLLYGTRPRMGSGSSLKQRRIPTISEGIEAGLTPTSFDPIETTMRYVANMDRFLASNEIFATGKASGMIKFYGPGKEPAGWVPLQGRLAGPTPYQQRAYAPEGYARVYNRSAHVDPGIQGSPAFQAVMRTKNAFTQTLLGFSGYHYLAMSQEAAVSTLARALGDLTDREFTEAAKKAGLASTLIGPAVRNLPKGRKLQKAYLRQLPANDPAAALYNRVADDLAAAGGRIVGRGQEWRGTAMSDYWTAWKRGTISPEFRARLASVGMGPLSTAPLRAGQMFFSEVGRIMETLNKPLFDHMVPYLKGGAFFDEMEAWLAKNPNASRSEEYAQASKLWTAMDDRFGELVQDRLFWHQNLKQGLQAIMVSPGWEIGSARALGGGLTDLVQGKWTPRTRWLVAFPVIVGLSDAVYQYLRTGKGPQSATDLIAPQTGGKTPENAPERAILPGYAKDPLGWYKDPVAKLLGTLGPSTKFGREMVTGRDAFTGRPIVEDFPGAPSWLQQWGKHMLDSYAPIPLQQYEKGGQPGSALGLGSNVMGIRPAPGWITDPARAKTIEKAASLAETVRSLGSQIYAAQRKGDRAEMQKLVRERAAAIAERKKIMGAETERERRQKQGPPHIEPYAGPAGL